MHSLSLLYVASGDAAVQKVQLPLPGCVWISFSSRQPKVGLQVLYVLCKVIAGDCSRTAGATLQHELAKLCQI